MFDGPGRDFDESLDESLEVDFNRLKRGIGEERRGVLVGGYGSRYIFLNIKDQIDQKPRKKKPNCREGCLS